MKRTFSIFVLVIVILFATCLFTACGEEKNEDAVLESVNKYLSATSNAILIEQSVTIKSDDMLVSSENTVYSVKSEGVNGTTTIKTLNPDITGDELYIEEKNNFSFAASEAQEKLPVNFVVDKSKMKDETYFFDGNLLSFSIANTSVQAYLGLAESEAASINSDIEVKIFVSNEKISSIEAIYDTSNGHRATIKIIYNYGI